jgi:hypothetical protein
MWGYAIHSRGQVFRNDYDFVDADKAEKAGELRLRKLRIMGVVPRSEDA